MEKTTRSNVIVILFIVAMNSLAGFTASAQNGINNPLFQVTGTNVLGQGLLRWDNDMEFYHIHSKYSYDFSNYDFDGILNSIGYRGSLRYGVGSQAELTLNLTGNYTSWNPHWINDAKNINPSVGAKLLLYDGKGILPQTAFYTNVGATVVHGVRNIDSTYTLIQPEIGFQFRNNIGKRCVVDYTIGFSWNEYSINAAKISNSVQFEIFCRWLATDRLMLGIGGGTFNAVRRPTGVLEARYYANDGLQLTLQAGISGTSNNYGHEFQTNTLLGLSWNINHKGRKNESR